MKITIQFDKLNTFGEIETVKEGTEVASKSAKPYIKAAFNLFRLKPEAIIRIGNTSFSWSNFEEKKVLCSKEGSEEVLPVKKAERTALKIKA